MDGGGGQGEKRVGLEGGRKREKGRSAGWTKREDREREGGGLEGRRD